MPLPYDFEGKGAIEFVAEASSSISSSSSCSLSPYSNLLPDKWSKRGWFPGSEPTSVLDTIGSPSPPASSSTLSSSLGGCGGGGSGGSIATATAAAEKCGIGMDDWESQEQSVLGWIMGDVEDPSMGLNKLLQSGGGTPAELEFNSGYGVVDQAYGLDPANSTNPSLPTSGFAPIPPFLPDYKISNPPNPNLSPLSDNLVPISFPQPLESADLKPQIFNSELLINQHQSQQTQNPAMLFPLSNTQQDHHLVFPPPPKRHNPSGLEANPNLSHQLHFLPPYLPQRPTTIGMKPKMAGDEMGHQQQQQQQQQAVMDQLYKAAELVQAGNPALAQGILARLNHQLSPIGKPFHRAAFFCKQALQLLLHEAASLPHSSPYNLILKIGAYKSFSEISPFLQFANFTCNQALLEVLDGFDRIHIIDFEIGYGGQWASLMQELALRNGGPPSLKITALASSSTDQLELGLTRENLNHFATEINITFEFEILRLESLNSASWSFDDEAIAVNLPVGSFSNHQLSLPTILSFLKQLCPKIVVSVDRTDRTDLPFPNHLMHTLQSCSNLLESLDAVNVNPDALQKIERFLIQPGIEKTLLGRYHALEKTPHWRTLFLSSGFSPIMFSNFAESQAECVVKRTPVRGFHVEKRQASLVLCWQRKELISASAWRC